jgi:acyl-CoA synthetase (AMP-forming)/AMP-acid ligase II
VEIVGCGFPLEGTELRIADNEGEALEDRRIGRIEFRGTSATAGYWRSPALTARLMKGGWLDTGDVGYIANGELFVTGRAKDMIIRGGRHFFPYELEETIGQLPGVVHGSVAVCGSPSASGATERLVIFAETRLTDMAQRQGLKARIEAATIALYGSPAEQVALVPHNSILRTPGGKIRHAATLQAFTSNGGVLAGRSVWRQLHFTCFFAILLCNAIPVPLYPPAQLQALQEHVARNAAILANAQVKALIAFDKVAAIAQLLALRVPELRHVLHAPIAQTMYCGRSVRTNSSRHGQAQLPSKSTLPHNPTPACATHLSPHRRYAKPCNGMLRTTANARISYWSTIHSLKPGSATANCTAKRWRSREGCGSERDRAGLERRPLQFLRKFPDDAKQTPFSHRLRRRAARLQVWKGHDDTPMDIGQQDEGRLPLKPVEFN